MRVLVTCIPLSVGKWAERGKDDKQWMDHEEEGVAHSIHHSWVDGSHCLFGTIPPPKYKRKPGSIWSTNKVANTKCLSDHWAASMLSAALQLTEKELDGRSGSAELQVGYYKCPGLPHQWCRIWDHRQANPLSCCVWERVCVCVCVWWTERERETGLGYRQLLRVCTVCVEPWEASRIPPHHFHFITPGERTYIIQLFKPQSTGTDRAFNKHFNLNSLTDPPSATLSVYLVIPFHSFFIAVWPHYH